MFTMEEITLINIYISDAPEKNQMIKTLERIIKYYTDDDNEIKTLTLNTLEKLKRISDKEFCKIDFSQAICE